MTPEGEPVGFCGKAQIKKPPEAYFAVPGEEEVLPLEFQPQPPRRGGGAGDEEQGNNERDSRGLEGGGVVTTPDEGVRVPSDEMVSDSRARVGVRAGVGPDGVGADVVAARHRSGAPLVVGQRQEGSGARDGEAEAAAALAPGEGREGGGGAEKWQGPAGEAHGVLLEGGGGGAGGVMALPLGGDAKSPTRHEAPCAKLETCGRADSRASR